MGKLSGKAAIVTGGASGMGRGVALNFAEEGASVAVLDRNEAGAKEVAEAAAESGAKTIGLACDVGDEPSVKSAFAAAAEALGDIDIALLPVDGSQHVMGYVHTEAIIERLKPRVVIPHHYYIWDVLQRQSTLQPAEDWVASRKSATKMRSAKRIYRIKDLDKLDRAVHFFGDHVAFDKDAWMEAGR